MSNEGAVIITGGGSGIGAGIAETLSAEGYRLVIAGRQPERLNTLATQLRRRGGDCLPVAADVTSIDGRRTLVEEARKAFGRIAVLVNNAGGASGWQPLLRYEEAAWDRDLRVNLTAPFLLARDVLCDMREAGWGRIINIGSVYGSLGTDIELYHDVQPKEGRPMRATAYNSAKSGLYGLTRDLAVGVARWGVTVNLVSPGMIDVPGKPLASSGANGDAEAARAALLRKLEERTPVGRIGTPQDVAHAVRFLIDRRASFITGQEVIVDGGWSCW